MISKEQWFNERLSLIGMLERIPRFIDRIERQGSLIKVYMTFHFLQNLKVCCSDLRCYCPALCPRGLEELLLEINDRSPFQGPVTELRIHVNSHFCEGFQFAAWSLEDQGHVPSSIIDTFSFPP